MKFFTLSLLLLLTFTSTAQDSSFNGWYGNPKIGASFPENGNVGIFIGAEFAYLRNNMIFSLDIGRSQEVILLFGGKTQSVNQLGLMFGGYLTKGIFQLQGQIGIAPTYGEVKRRKLSSGWFSSTYSFKYFWTLGVVSKVRIGFMPSKYVSIGLDLLANFNKHQFVFAPAVSVQIGILYKKRD